jgi:oligoendopeptidase F
MRVMNIRRRLVALAALIIAPAVPCAAGSAQQATAALAPDSTIRHRYDLERYLFPSPAAEVAQRAHLEALLKELESLKVNASHSAASLYSLLVLADSVAAQAKRHSTYLYLRSETNTLDRASAEAQSAIDAQAGGAAAQVRAELQGMKASEINRFFAQRPALEVYRFVINSARRYAPHTLNPSQEGVFSRLAPLTSDWPLELYDRAVARINFGTVQSPNGALDVYRQRGAIANSPDTAVRSAGNRMYWEGYNSQRDLFAAALIGSVRARNALAKEHHFDDAPTQVYFRAYLTPADVRALIERVRARADLMKRYQRILAAHARWGAMQRSSGRTPSRPPKLSLDSAGRLLETVLAPLGPLYERELVALFDPANGRIDVDGGQHRAAGGASFGAGVAESGIYLNTFEGFSGDVSRLAHEAGHAVENQFHFEGHVSPAYANGTSNAVGADYLSEAYAIFNSLILADNLLRRATSETEKQFYLVQFLGNAMEPFYGAQDADLEQSIYDGVSSGKVATADQLDSLTHHVDQAYDINTETRPELRSRWITRRLMIEDPVYYFNYLYSGIVSLLFFEQYSLDRGHFVPRYINLLRGGYRASPFDALRQSLGIDLSDPRLLDHGISLIEERVSELEALFAKQEAERAVQTR